MKTSFIAVIVHALVFASILYYTRSIDGFQTITDETYKAQMTGSLVGGGFLGFLLGIITMNLYTWSQSRGYAPAYAPTYAPAPAYAPPAPSR